MVSTQAIDRNQKDVPSFTTRTRLHARLFCRKSVPIATGPLEAKQTASQEREDQGTSKHPTHTPTRSAPFSIGILAHSLESCAIPPDVAVYGARKILASVQQTGHREIDHKSLRRIIYRCLHEHCDTAMAERYR